MADGLAKLQVRQKIVEKLKRMTRALKYDATFTAGKKIGQEDTVKAEKDLDEGAADFDEANAEEDVTAESEAQMRESVRATSAVTRTARR